MCIASSLYHYTLEQIGRHCQGTLRILLGHGSCYGHLDLLVAWFPLSSHTYWRGFNEFCLFLLLST